MVLAFGLLLVVAGLRSKLKRFVDQKGVVRVGCLPVDMHARGKQQKAGGEQEEREAVLEALLREAAGAIERNDQEMRTVRQQLEQLERKQQELTCRTTKITLLSRRSICAWSPEPEQLRNDSSLRSVGMPGLLQVASPLEDSTMAERDERERSFLRTYLTQKKIDRLTGTSGDLSARSRGNRHSFANVWCCSQILAPSLQSDV